MFFGSCYYRENPELYLEQLRAKYKDLSEKVEQRKRLKTNGDHSNGNNLSGGIGRGERLSAAQRERMRLLTTAAFDRGKGEDTFGAKDEDWQLYKLMSKDNDDGDEGPDEDDTELARISSKLQVYFHSNVNMFCGLDCVKPSDSDDSQKSCSIVALHWCRIWIQLSCPSQKMVALNLLRHHVFVL